MSIYQIAYAALLACAIWHGKPDWRIAAVCVLNFAGTMALADGPISVGILDMITVSLLITIGTRQAKKLALAFTILPAVYIVGTYLAWHYFTIYAIADLSAVVILGVLANGSGGNSKRTRYAHFNLGRVTGRLSSQASRGYDMLARRVRMVDGGKSQRLTQMFGGLYRGN